MEPAKSCSNCERTQTPIWRKGPNGAILCNACGLYLKQQGCNRPNDIEPLPKARRGRKPKDKRISYNEDDNDEDDDYADGTRRLRNDSAAKESADSTPAPRKRGRPRIHPIVEDRATAQLKKQKSEPAPVNAIPVPPCPFDYGVESEVEKMVPGPKYVYYTGQRFDIGDYVAVRGDVHAEYFGIIAGFELRRDGARYFWMRWLVPKYSGEQFRARLAVSDIDRNDFVQVQPELTTCEKMDSISFLCDTSVPTLTTEDDLMRGKHAVDTSGVNILDYVQMRKLIGNPLVYSESVTSHSGSSTTVNSALASGATSPMPMMPRLILPGYPDDYDDESDTQQADSVRAVEGR